LLLFYKMFNTFFMRQKISNKHQIYKKNDA